VPAPSLVILTGAGVSKESGLDTFRDAGGLWSRVRIEDVATPEAFARDPAGVHAFYNARRRNMLSANIQPNAAHRALADLERGWAGDFLLVTQNIDDLHERAGSTKLVHMHGEMLKTRCTHCGTVESGRADLSLATRCATCSGAGGMRPHVVWFGEMPLAMDLIYDALARCRIFISIGTSGNVYPAAGFVAEARRAGARTVELNLEPSEGASLFAERRYGLASEIVPQFVEALLAPGDAARSARRPEAR
jgi:NAD-dependent deacetylase